MHSPCQEKFSTRARNRAVVLRRGEYKSKFKSVVSLSLLGHELGHFLLVFDQNCRVYIEKSEAIGFFLTPFIEILRFRHKTLTTLYYTSGYAPRGLQWHFKCFFLYLKYVNVAFDVYGCVKLSRSLARSFGTDTQTNILLLQYKDWISNF